MKPTMKALRLQAIGDLQLTHLPRPDATDGMVVLKVSHCAICRTDLKMWRQGQRDLRLPRILGHEVAAADAETGVRFVVWPGESCGNCQPCRSGAENLCGSMRILGFHRDGGFAEYMAVPETALVPIPAALPGTLACLAEPLACGLNALDQASLTPDQSLLIFGAGAVGLLIGLAARERGARVFMHDINPAKLERSVEYRRRLGIEIVPLEQIPPVHLAINACPAIDAFYRDMAMLADGGSFCLFSGFTDQCSLPVDLFNEIHYRQLRMVGAYGCTRPQLTEAVRLLSRHAPEAELLIDGIIRLEDVLQVLPAMVTGQALKYVVAL